MITQYNPSLAIYNILNAELKHIVSIYMGNKMHI